MLVGQESNPHCKCDSITDVITSIYTAVSFLLPDLIFLSMTFTYLCNVHLSTAHTEQTGSFEGGGGLSKKIIWDDSGEGGGLGTIQNG